MSRLTKIILGVGFLIILGWMYRHEIRRNTENELQALSNAVEVENVEQTIRYRERLGKYINSRTFSNPQLFFNSRDRNRMARVFFRADILMAEVVLDEAEDCIDEGAIYEAVNRIQQAKELIRPYGEVKTSDQGQFNIPQDINFRIKEIEEMLKRFNRSKNTTFTEWSSQMA